MKESSFSIELRKTYLGAAPHTLVTGLLWIAGGLMSRWLPLGQAILLFLLACTFNFLLGELVRYMMGAKNYLSKENSLPKLFMLMGFSIPMTYPIVYLACKTNINYFFPSFSILVGAHYLPFIYGYGMSAFGIMSILLVGTGFASAIWFTDQFALSAYMTGTILVLFAFINYGSVKKELI